MEAAALDDEQRRLVRELQMNSAMVVPLVARDRTLGAMTFVWAESGRQYTTRELELALELGRRAGLALDHARLFAREHAVAETLQRALLPAALPDLPGFELIVRYVPSDARDHAGGDWYDAFRLPDGRVGIVIGDVGGRGMDAAATMGQIRNSLRAYALKGAGPAEVIDDLYRLVDASTGAIAFATLVYVVLDERTGACDLASAGHLPPLIVGAAGGAHFTETPRCPPLGFSDADPSTLAHFEIAPGETLWLYTDGLVESRRRPIDVGLAALADAAGRAEGGLEEIAEHLLATLPGSRDDDIALLALRRVLSGLVTGIDPLGAMERELVLRARAGRDRLQEIGVVVAGVEALQHTAGEPVLAAVEDRDAVHVAPRRALELVHLVAGLAAEQLGEVLGVGGHRVHTEHRRVPAVPERAVGVREADDEARRVDAGLGGEADQAAERLAVGRARRDDEHRVLEIADEAIEVVHGRQ